MKSEILSKFGMALRQARTKKGLSQEALAEATNLDRTYISLLETGKRNPSLICITIICAALDKKLSSLMHDVEDIK
ncbi:helix-turn-helix domain-containing protein [Legionella pneumophila]|uniref:helix-turn-helix domain-containing protein n=1 Tax=Legionella pneumophila TaxID=446 RepID=UPI001F4EDABB|nr:helix-turn-helix transcriptional regulator [Legionella pneumophila]MDW8886685.1 helix-turn-helix transcriptional regulator [Legionella pneumophila]